MSTLTEQPSYAQVVFKLFLFTSMGAFTTMSQTVTPQSTASSRYIISPPASILVIPTAVPDQSYNNSIRVTMEFLQISWIKEFLDRKSPVYKALESNISEAVENVFNGRVEVIQFKPGSVLAFLTLSSHLGDMEVKTLLEDEIKNGTIGNLSVSPTLFFGSLFDIVLKVATACNESAQDKGSSAKDDLLDAVKTELANNNVTVRKISCLDPGNVTIVTLRVDISQPSTENPDKELKRLKDEVNSGKLENVSVVPDWVAYIPGEKQFYATFDLKNATSDENKTSTDLEAGITSLYKNDANFKYVTVEIKDGKTAVVKIGMKATAPEIPKQVLQLLKESVNKKGKVGSISVVKGSYKAMVNPQTLTEKLFEVHFRQIVPNCSVSRVNDSRYKDAEQAAINVISGLQRYEYFTGYKLKNLECVKNDTVYAVFNVSVKADAPSNVPHKIIGSLRFSKLCSKDTAIYDWGMKIVFLTPTTLEKFNYVHYVCFKSTTTKSPKTTDTTVGTTPKEEVPTALPLPKVYVKIRLGITWGEFCSKLEHSLKQKIAWNLYDKNGNIVSPERIIFLNVEKNCKDPRKKDEQAEVWFYASKKSGSNDLHKCLTLKAYKVFKMFLENGNTKHLGPHFEGKVIHVVLVGEDASKYKSKEDSGKLSTLAIILVAVAGALGLVLLTIACCCLFCCGAQRRRRGKHVETQKLQLVHVDGNETGNRNKGKKGKDNREDDENDSNKYAKRKLEKEKNQSKRDKVISYENQAYQTGKGPENGESNSNLIKPAPVIVTSPAPVAVKLEDKKVNQTADSSSSTPVGGSRRGSSSPGEEGQGSHSSPLALRHIDADLKDRERRRSSVHSLIDDEDVPLTHKTGTVGIVALALRNRNEKKKEAEFKNLNKDVPDEEVKYPSNTQVKNRSPDVLPAPKTRVKLSSTPDYINANWIRDHEGKRRYIATQHPLHETVADLWRMVWDQHAHLIVMVNEEEKEKPAEFIDYLPKGEGNTKTFGGFDVAVKQIVQKPDYILTVVNLAESKKSSSSREISHMRFTSWKERAMPNVALFVGFVTATRDVRRKKCDNKAPTIVHCSDGLGFSGVYIAVDIGIKSHEESKTSVVDVFELSKNLRHDRHGIVCSLDHYNFIYQALYEYTVNYDESAEIEKL